MSDPDHVTFTAGDASVTVDLRHGGRLSSLSIGGVELLARIGTGAIEWGAYIMAPYAGRVRHGVVRWGDRAYQLPVTMPPHAIHGTVLSRRWRQISDATFACDLGPDWPWPGLVTHTIHLTAQSLHLGLTVTAHGAPFPASAGWHPWFRRHLPGCAPAVLSLEAATMLQRGVDGLPDGTRVTPPAGPFDDCFTDLRSPAAINWPGGPHLTVDSSCDYLVVYDEHPDALCLEPQTAPPNSLDQAESVVRPTSPLSATTTWTWSALP